MKIDLVSPTAAPPSPTPQKPTTESASDDRSTAFRPVQGGNEMQSGEKLLVEAYAAIWIILFAMVLLSWRRQRGIDERISGLEGAIDKARREKDEEEAAAKGGA